MYPVILSSKRLLITGNPLRPIFFIESDSFLLFLVSGRSNTATARINGRFGLWLRPVFYLPNVEGYYRIN